MNYDVPSLFTHIRRCYADTVVCTGSGVNVMFCSVLTLRLIP